MIAVAPSRDLVVVVATEFDERDDRNFEKAPPGDRIFTMVETIAAHFGTAD